MQLDICKQFNIKLKKSQILIISPNLKSSNVILNIQSPAGEIKTV